MKLQQTQDIIQFRLSLPRHFSISSSLEIISLNDRACTVMCSVALHSHLMVQVRFLLLAFMNLSNP